MVVVVVVVVVLVVVAVAVLIVVVVNKNQIRKFIPKDFGPPPNDRLREGPWYTRVWALTSL